MREVTIKLYQYAELNDAAKAKARDWYREIDTFDPEMECYETAARLLGITFGTHTVKTVGGKTRDESDIFWSGFCSQGDGASFKGTYAYVGGCAKAVRKEFPTWTELHEIADTLTSLQSSVKGFRLRAVITTANRIYSHSSTMRLELVAAERDDDVWERLPLEDELLAAMRAFADLIWLSLMAEYEYQRSDEAVSESIEANEYEFCASGKRASGC